MELAEIMALLLYLLGAIALVLLIIILWRIVQIMQKVDQITDDIYLKTQKLNGLFDIADKLELLNDRVINAIVNGIMKFFSKKREGDDLNE